MITGKSIEYVNNLESKCDRLQAEVERLEELFRLAVERFNDAEKLVIHKDEQLVAMTARCKAAEDLLVECKDTILYIKQYVDGQGLSAEDDGDNMIKAINDFLGVMQDEV